MLNQTTILAIRALIFLSSQPRAQICPPRLIAGKLKSSSAYMAKVLRLLVKVGILRAERGKNGGVVLYRPPDRISLLTIVEACQGTLVASVCQEDCGPESTCAFHKAAQELHEATIQVLKKWDLKQLAQQPIPSAKLKLGFPCLMSKPNRHKGEHELHAL
jgi:Rrf2 family nitric oxide-sensitive transcriptional repressor